MRKLLPLTLTLAVLAVAVFGCAGLHVLNPFDAIKASDAEWVGIAGPVTSIPGSIDPRIAEAQSILTLVGAGSILDPLGVFLPLKVEGEVAPRQVLCVGEWAIKCKAMREGVATKFAGYGLGGDRWLPHRLSQ